MIYTSKCFNMSRDDYKNKHQKLYWHRIGILIFRYLICYCNIRYDIVLYNNYDNPDTTEEEEEEEEGGGPRLSKRSDH